MTSLRPVKVDPNRGATGMIMNQILKMKNKVQPYSWGSRRALADFLGDGDADGTPRAELWMGAHPKSPSMVWLDGQWEKLDELIQRDCPDILGPCSPPCFENQLPYLFKVLAADQPLSIQAHPSRQQAREGFARENNQGIPLTAGHRNYKDANHKPECICALTPFWGLCGFRPMDDMLRLIDTVWPGDNPDAGRLLAPLLNNRDLRLFFQGLMTLPVGERERLVGQVLGTAKSLVRKDNVYDWMLRLNDHYPNDIGVLSPILLNLFCLAPEQALFLPAGQLHAYLGGMGIEIMTNSDNVLRGGLTPKHVDVPELLKVLDFTPAFISPLPPEAVGPCEYRYPSRAEEFVLSRLDLSPPTVCQGPDASRRSAEILLCTRGEAMIRSEPGAVEIRLVRGRSAFVPAAVQSYTVSGDATLYKAAANLPGCPA